MSRSTFRSIFNSVRINGEDDFVCACGLPTKEYLVRKKDSPYCGMKFWACAKHFRDPGCCDTKIWFDEEARVRGLLPPAVRSPRTPRKQIDIRKFGQYTPVSSKRKPGAESFDSAVGDLNDRDSVLFSPSRSTKRSRRANVTPPGESSAVSSESLGLAENRAVLESRPLPRRRLFDEFMEDPRYNLKAGNDELAQPRRRRTVTFASQTVNHTRDAETQTEDPNELVGDSSGLITPPRANLAPSSSSPQDQSKMRERTPPKTGCLKTGSQTTQIGADSDQEYGWDGDMAGDLLEFANDVENSSLSPLFV
ncbi:hypothetical protein BJX99DRAFT_62314 [Aspergillus californicus]